MVGLKMKNIFPQLLIYICFGIYGSISPTKSQPNIYEAILIEENLETTNISTQEFIQIITNKSATVFDVRSFQEYSIGHIPGTLNVEGKPGTTREAFTSDIAQINLIVGRNKDTPIVLYCAGIYCGKSIRVADDLVEAGYENIRRY
jgi:rhodanese-related sulfurtransferase